MLMNFLYLGYIYIYFKSTQPPRVSHFFCFDFRVSILFCNFLNKIGLNFILGKGFITYLQNYAIILLFIRVCIFIVYWILDKLYWSRRIIISDDTIKAKIFVSNLPLYTSAIEVNEYFQKLLGLSDGICCDIVVDPQHVIHNNFIMPS